MSIARVQGFQASKLGMNGFNSSRQPLNVPNKGDIWNEQSIEIEAYGLTGVTKSAILNLLLLGSYVRHDSPC